MPIVLMRKLSGKLMNFPVYKPVYKQCRITPGFFWNVVNRKAIFNLQLRKSRILQKRLRRKSFKRRKSLKKSIGLVSHTCFGRYKNKLGAFSFFLPQSKGQLPVPYLFIRMIFYKLLSLRSRMYSSISSSLKPTSWIADRISSTEYFNFLESRLTSCS